MYVKHRICKNCNVNANQRLTQCQTEIDTRLTQYQTEIENGFLQFISLIQIDKIDALWHLDALSSPVFVSTISVIMFVSTISVNNSVILFVSISTVSVVLYRPSFRRIIRVFLVLLTMRIFLDVNLVNYPG